MEGIWAQLTVGPDQRDPDSQSATCVPAHFAQMARRRHQPRLIRGWWRARWRKVEGGPGRVTPPESGVAQRYGVA